MSPGTVKKKYRAAQTKNNRLKKRLFTKTEKEKHSEKVQKAVHYVSSILNGGARDFFLSQIKLSARSKYGYRWTEDEKCFALTLFHSSPKCYRLLSKTFALPSIRTLRRCMNNFQIESGFHPSILEGLKNRVSKMNEQQKLCSIVFDEMAIKENIRYNAASDRVEGFESLYQGQSSKYIANHACVFMVRGIIENWKQAFGFFFSSGPMPAEKLKILLTDAINALNETGLNVKIVICDQGSNNRSMLQKLGVTVTSPFFHVNSKKIYAMYDPPHLIKNVRNNLKKTGYTVNGEDISWEDITKFYEIDSKLSIRTAPKLTKKHIELPPFTAMRVKLATQVLSHTVAAGITMLCSFGHLESKCMATANFIKRFDQLFDIFNSGKLYAKKPFKVVFHWIIIILLSYLRRLNG